MGWLSLGMFVANAEVCLAAPRWEDSLGNDSDKVQKMK